jgi:hypothetical protein
MSAADIATNRDIENLRVLRATDAGGAVGVESQLHHYISTACQHGRHSDCRLVCKYCGAKCECASCEHAEINTDETLRPVRDALHELRGSTLPSDGPLSVVLNAVPELLAEVERLRSRGTTIITPSLLHAKRRTCTERLPKIVADIDAAMRTSSSASLVHWCECAACVATRTGRHSSDNAHSCCRHNPAVICCDNGARLAVDKENAEQTRDQQKAISDLAEQVRQLRLQRDAYKRIVDDMNASLAARVATLEGEVAVARASNKTLHRRAQKAEGELERLTRTSNGGTWKSPERRAAARTSDAAMEAVQKVAWTPRQEETVR